MGFYTAQTYKSEFCTIMKPVFMPVYRFLYETLFLLYTFLSGKSMESKKMMEKEGFSS